MPEQEETTAPVIATIDRGTIRCGRTSVTVRRVPPYPGGEDHGRYEIALNKAIPLLHSEAPRARTWFEFRSWNEAVAAASDLAEVVEQCSVEGEIASETIFEPVRDLLNRLTRHAEDDEDDEGGGLR